MIAEHLSTDAAPAVAEYIEEREDWGVDEDWVQKYIRAVEKKTDDMSLRTYNFSYAKAKRLLTTE